MITDSFVSSVTTCCITDLVVPLYVLLKYQVRTLLKSCFRKVLTGSFTLFHILLNCNCMIFSVPVPRYGTVRYPYRYCLTSCLPGCCSLRSVPCGLFFVCVSYLTIQTLPLKQILEPILPSSLAS